MKILHITPSYEPAWHLGGVVRSLSQLCQGLVKLGHDVTVFTTDSGQDRRLDVPVNQQVEIGGVKVFYFETGISLRFADSRRLLNACRRMKGNFDIVHLTAFWCFPGIVGGHYARRWSIPYVVSTAGTVREKAMRRKAWKKWLYMYAIELRNLRQAAAIRCVTEMEQKQNAYLPVSTPSFVVPNGIDLKEMADFPEPSQARKQLGIEPGAFVGLFVGRLDPVKRVDLVIEAIGLAKGRGMEIFLLIAGPDWGELPRLQDLVAEKGLNGQVKFLGTVSPETRNCLLAASNFLALTSDEESFGYAAVEALFAGRPVVISPGVGISPVVAAEKAGIVVPQQPEAICQAIVNLARDQSLWMEMGKNARHCAGAHFEIMAVARKMGLAYEDILNHRRTPELAWSDGN
jgi:glycosyltransferase involved in cell wall biosynthesis